jgi:hypothetical protein
VSRKLSVRLTPVQLRIVEHALVMARATDPLMRSEPGARALTEVRAVIAKDPHRVNCHINRGGTCSCGTTSPRS